MREGQSYASPDHGASCWRTPALGATHRPIIRGGQDLHERIRRGCSAAQGGKRPCADRSSRWASHGRRSRCGTGGGFLL